MENFTIAAAVQLSYLAQEEQQMVEAVFVGKRV